MLRVVAILFVLGTTLVGTASAGAAGHAMPLPNGLRVIEEPCPVLGANGLPADGCAYPDGTVYVRPGAAPFTRWHEIGHVFATQHLSSGDHHWFMRVFHMRGAWKSEVFADSYASCQVGMWDGGYTFFPSRQQKRAICAAIRRVGVR